METNNNERIVPEENLKSRPIISVINGVNIIYEDDFTILSDVVCEECGEHLRYGEVIDCYTACEECRKKLK